MAFREPSIVSQGFISGWKDGLPINYASVDTTINLVGPILEPVGSKLIVEVGKFFESSIFEEIIKNVLEISISTTGYIRERSDDPNYFAKSIDLKRPTSIGALIDAQVKELTDPFEDRAKSYNENMEKIVVSHLTSEETILAIIEKLNKFQLKSSGVKDEKEK